MRCLPHSRGHLGFDTAMISGTTEQLEQNSARSNPVKADVSEDIFDVTVTFDLGDAKVVGLDMGRK